MKPKHQRMIFIFAGLLSIAAAIALILSNFNDNIVFFYSPHELAGRSISSEKTIRIGGLVAEGSVTTSGNVTKFTLTDLQGNVPVKYTGILPPMFREGQGMVAEGKLGSKGALAADRLLTKHDEKYMPPEVAKALKKSGQWKGE